MRNSSHMLHRPMTPAVQDSSTAASVTRKSQIPLRYPAASWNLAYHQHRTCLWPG